MEYAHYNSTNEKYLTAPYTVKPKVLKLQNSSAANSGTPIKYEGSKDSYIKFCKRSLFSVGKLEFHWKLQDKMFYCLHFFLVLSLTKHYEFMATGCFCSSWLLNTQSTPVGARNFRFSSFLCLRIISITYLSCKSILWESCPCQDLTLKGRILICDSQRWKMFPCKWK